MTHNGMPQRRKNQVVTATIEQYWYEVISRNEALRRLSKRPLDRKTRNSIAKEIPDSTLHILTFQRGVFREYARFGEKPANLLLMLPLQITSGKKRGYRYGVVGPINMSERRDDGRVRNLCGIEIDEFWVSGTRLIENGVPRSSFRFSEGPLQLEVDTTFLSARRRVGHVKGTPCCKACEWVHSKLDIHHLDWICCLGTCDPPIEGDFPVPRPGDPVPA
jgi:hypothetical protein